MVPVARRNLLAEPARLLISVGGVALAVLLILVLQSLYQGFNKAAGSFIASLPADVWVAQYGATDVFHTASFMPISLGRTVAEAGGVESATPILARRMNVRLGEGTAGLFLFAVGSPVGSGQIKLVEGKEAPGVGEVLIDEVFGRKYGFVVGDHLDLGSGELAIAGIFSGGNTIISQFALVTPEDALSLFGQPGLVNYFLVKVKAGFDADAVALQVERNVPGASVYTAAEFVENSRRGVADIFLPIIAVLVFIAAVVGAAVVGLTIYTATIEKSREFGVLKAMGATPGFLYRVVLVQSVTVGLLGFGVGMAAALGVNALAQEVVPEFVTYLRWVDVVWVLGTALLMSLVAVYLPVRRIAALDPAAVFRA